MSPTVLLAHSLAWPNVARLAIACRKAGFVVEALAPEGHPVHRMKSPRRTFLYRPHNPGASLREAVEASRPQLIIPCDDRVVAHLHRLHAETARRDGPRAMPWISRLIETSLGSPGSFEILRQRRLLGELSDLAGVDVPRTDAIGSFRQLKDWVGAHGLPAVLKLDGSTGGRDVVRIADREAISTAYLEMRLRRSGLRTLKGALSNGDVEPLFQYFRDSPGVSVQSYVAGRPANCAVACWRGEVLAAVAVETVRVQSEFGISTVVRIVEGRAMKAAARSIVRHLRLSGMCGFDFVLDDASDRAALIEINPRATQISHFPWGPGPDLSTALRRAVEGTTKAPGDAFDSAPAPMAEIALFPQEWRRDPDNWRVGGAFHDVPAEEPDFVKFYGYDPSSAAVGSVDEVYGRDMTKLRDSAPMADEEILTSCEAVLLRAGDAAAPLFILPGIDCDVEEVRGLAERLRGDRSVFGLRIDFRTERADLLATVDQMASQAVEAIRAIQPGGPYHLAGYSFGGTVAFEAAMQLHRSGDAVEFLALIGTPIAQRYWPMPILVRSVARRTARHLWISSRQPIGVAAPILARRAARLTRLVAQRVLPKAFVPPAPGHSAGRQGPSGRAAMERYRPGFYPGKLTLLEPHDEQEFFCDFSALWRAHAAILDVHSLPTDHLGFVRDPATIGLVSELFARIEPPRLNPASA